MVYVERDSEGRVTGLFETPQPGSAEECLAADHEDVLAYHDALLNAVPAAVTAAQAKITLDAAGLYDAVRTICLNHPVRAVQIYWTSATVWERGNAYVQAIGAELDLDDDEIDDLFRAAAALT